jgi:hypothetical protein
VKPTDVFVLFLGGHGRSIAGKYYFLQQDLDFSRGQSIERDAISQDLWQTWLAKIVAQKTLLVFDTCESAAAAGLVRGGERERQTAMEQLQNATGNNLIAAARQAALEGLQRPRRTHVHHSISLPEAAGGHGEGARFCALAITHSHCPFPTQTRQVLRDGLPIVVGDGRPPSGERRLHELKIDLIADHPPPRAVALVAATTASCGRACPLCWRVMDVSGTKRLS